MTILRLENLYPQGELDRGECSIKVEKETYNDLPIMPEKDFKDYIIEIRHFSEIYRGHSKNESSLHKAIVLYNPNNKEEVDEDDELIDKQTYWYFVWIEKEGVWIVFQYKDITTIGETYNSTVETAFPWHGEVYRPNDEIMSLIKQILS